MAKHIALYGKGGTGKTTIAANLSAALAEAGWRVLLVGCSPTADSSHLIVGEAIPCQLFGALPNPEVPDRDKIITSGYRGIGCIEIGESAGTDYCQSRNLAAGLKLLKELAIIETYEPNFVIYDMPGNVGCAGEMMLPESADTLSLLVTTADFQSLFAANRLIGQFSRSRRQSPLALVANGSISSFEDSFVADFADQAGIKVAVAIPRSFAVRQSELYGKTVIEAGPLSNHAYTYRKLARLIYEGGSQAYNQRNIEPLEAARLKEWAHEWGKRLGELEFGIISDGAGI